MDRKEFSMWQALTESSTYRWVEDEIVRLNGRGARYYQGGESGVYMEITPEGRLTAGTYEGAIPHIGEALFTQKAARDCGSFDKAFQMMCEIGGKQFLIDMFTARPELPMQVPESAGWGTMNMPMGGLS